MPGRGPQTFKKRQKEQQRKEKQEAKAAKRHARKENAGNPEPEEEVLAPESGDSESPSESPAASQ